MKNKYLKSLFLATMCAVAFTACGTNTNNTEDNAENVTEAEPTAEATEETEEAEDSNTEEVTETLESNMISVGKFQKAVKEELGIDTVDTIFSEDYQDTAAALIEEYKTTQEYTMDQALYIMNPYGTSRTSVYAYFETEEAVNINYTVSVEDETISDYTASMYSNDEGTPVTEHEGQIIGLLPGMTNIVTLEAVDAEGNVIDTVNVSFEVPDFGTLDVLQYEMTEEGDLTQLSNGLYTIMDYDLQDSEEYSHIICVDNTGVVRAELIMDAIKTCPVVEFIGDYMVYPASFDKIVMVDRFGKAEEIYSLGDYKYHHDMEYNAANNTIAILADDTNKDTIEEIVISLDLETGEVTEIMDFEDMMPDIYERATRPEINMTYGTEFDWIHFNSIVFINDTDVLLSARELSSIIRVNDVYGTPTIEYIIADSAIWEGTAYEDLVLTKVGQFSSQAGQHNLTIVADDSLEDGQYYVTMFNNNWGYSPTWPEFDWSTLTGVNLEQYEQTEEIGSAYYKYLVDDNAGIYTLVESVEVPYSSFVSDSYDYEGNIVYGCGVVATSGLFGECDSDGNTIVQFSYGADAFVGAYRTMKFSYQGFWFN